MKTSSKKITTYKIDYYFPIKSTLSRTMSNKYLNTYKKKKNYSERTENTVRVK